MSTLPPVPPRIVRVAAPLLLGGLWNWCLFGVLLVQFYVYIYNFSKDNRHLKILVYTVFFLETVQTALSGADIFYWFASGYGDITHLGSPFASSFDVPIIEAMVSAIVQFFYAYRVWVLSSMRSWCFCVLICLCSTLNAVAGITGGIHTYTHGKFASPQSLRSIAIAWLVGNSVADILIASAMLYYLAKRRKEIDGFLNDNYLVKLIRLTIETNLVTTSVGIVAVLMILIAPDENWYTCPTAILGKLYSNTLLVWFNNRISIRKAADAQIEVNRSPVIPLSITIRSDITTFMGDEQSQVAHKYSGNGAV